MSHRVQDALCWCFSFLLAGALTFVLALAGAYGKNLDGRYDNAPNKEWYERQVNKKASGAATRPTATLTTVIINSPKTVEWSSIFKVSMSRFRRRGF